MTSFSGICWAKNTESICRGPDVDYARENCPKVSGSHCYQHLFLLAPSLSVAFCVFNLFSDRASLCNYKMAVRSSWGFKSSEIVQESLSHYFSTRPRCAFIGLAYVTFLTLNNDQIDLGPSFVLCPWSWEEYPIQQTRLRVGKG